MFREEFSMGNPSRSNKALKRKKTVQTIIAITAVVLVILLALVLFFRQKVQNSVNNQNTSKVKTAAVTTGSIRATVSGSGTLTSDNIQDINVPAGVTVDTVYVEQGDNVEEGTLLASVKASSVLTTLADVQDALDDLDDELRDASNDTVSSNIKAGVTGRLKALFAQKDDDVAAVMYEHGALALISLDGYMAVDVEAGDYAAGDEVTVETSDGKTYDGTVDLVTGDTATILITDDGPKYDDEVTVGGRDTGRLYIHSPLKVTGYAGTISYVNASENAKVYGSTYLFGLKDTASSAKYDQLLADRAEYEELYQTLVKLYKDGGIVADRNGTVETVTDLDTVTPGTALLDEITVLTLDPNETMSVTIDVDETDILSLKTGQEVSITVDSIGDTVYTGTVTEIDTTAVSASGVTMYAATVTLDKAENMLSGMTASVDVTIEGVENALLVPEDAVQKTSATSYVYTAYDESTDTLGGMVEVTVGLSNGTYMEITGGLKEGDTVYYIPRETNNFFFTFAGTRGSTGSSKNQGGMTGMPGGMTGMPGGMSGMAGMPGARG